MLMIPALSSLSSKVAICSSRLAGVFSPAAQQIAKHPKKIATRTKLQVALEGTFHMTTVIPRFTLALLVRLIL